MNLVLGTINSKYIHSSLGIYSLAADLKSRNMQGIHFMLREYTTQTPLLNILADIQPLKPNIIALAIYIWNKEESFRLTKVIKEALPECIIVIGGPEVSFNSAQILAENSEIDYVVQGEGEDVFPQLLQFLQTGGQMPDSVSSRMQINKTVHAVQDLNQLPFAYADISTAELSNKIVYYESSRGCPYACSYCLSGISRNVRYKDFELTIQELQHLIKQGVKQVKFVDRTYNLDAKHYLPIMQFVAAQDTNTNFHFEIKADLLGTDILEFLGTVHKGRFQFEIGVQTTNSQTLKAINRLDNWKKLAENIKKLLGFGNIHLHVDLIAGLPHEDFATFKQSFNSVHNLGAEMLQLGFLKILHGSTIATEISEHGYKYMPCPPYEVLSNKYMSYAQLRSLKLIEDLVEKYYNSGRYKRTLHYLTQVCYHKEAFDFYEDFSIYLETNNWHMQSLSGKTNLELLLRFVRQNSTLQEYLTELNELLHLDTFIAGENWRIEFFASRIDTPANKDYLEIFWRDSESLSKYLPGYRFTSWRQIKKLYRMEEFLLANKRCIYIFDTQTENIITINSEDFYRVIQ